MAPAYVEKVRDRVACSRRPQHNATPRGELRLKLRQQSVEIF
jgi:hypothetical protein